MTTTILPFLTGEGASPPSKITCFCKRTIWVPGHKTGELLPRLLPQYFRGFLASLWGPLALQYGAFPYSCTLLAAAADYTLHSVPSMMHFKSAPAETALSGRALRMNSPSQCKVNPSVSPLSWFLPQSLPRFFRGSSAVRVKQQLHDSTGSRLREYNFMNYHELLPLSSSAVFRPTSADLPRCR